MTRQPFLHARARFVLRRRSADTAASDHADAIPVKSFIEVGARMIKQRFPCPSLLHETTSCSLALKSQMQKGRWVEQVLSASRRFDFRDRRARQQPMPMGPFISSRPGGSPLSASGADPEHRSIPSVDCGRVAGRLRKSRANVLDRTQDAPTNAEAWCQDSGLAESPTSQKCSTSGIENDVVDRLT